MKDKTVLHVGLPKLRVNTHLLTDTSTPPKSPPTLANMHTLLHITWCLGLVPSHGNPVSRAHPPDPVHTLTPWSLHHSTHIHRAPVTPQPSEQHRTHINTNTDLAQAAASPAG